MTKMDWSDAGDQIKNLVQDAVDSGDFSQLSSTITRVVNGAVDSVEDVLRESLGVGTGSSRSGRGGVFERDRSGREDGFGAAGRGRDGRSGREGSDRNGARGRERISREKVSEAAGEAEVLHGTVDGRGRHEAAERIRRNVEQRRSREYHPVRKKLKAPGLVSGRVMKWTGYSFGGMFGLSLAILAAVGLTTSFSMALPMSILGVLFGGSMLLGHKGSEKVGLATRFRRYTEVLGERTFCLIEELASSVGESSKFVCGAGAGRRTARGQGAEAPGQGQETGAGERGEQARCPGDVAGQQALSGVRGAARGRPGVYPAYPCVQ